MPKQISRLLIVFTLFIISFLVARHFLVPESFGKLGHYRANSLEENKKHDIKYIDIANCAMCHPEIDSLVKSGEHKSINCQTCHGPGFKHIEDPSTSNIIKPTTREFCGKCHAKNAARKESTIHQVDLKEHNVGNKCIECHIVHSPLTFKE